MGKFVDLIRGKLGLEPKRDKTLTGKIPNEVIVNRSQMEAVDPSVSTSNPVVFAPARMNPPTPAHREIIDTVLQQSKLHNAPYHVVLTRTQDKKKNPLTPEQKLKHARRFFPGVNITTAHPDRPNLLSQASDLHNQGHDHLVVVAGSDRIPEYERLLNTYNGKAGPHGFFNFKKISFVRAGQDRDEHSTGLSGWSATKSRAAAQAGDYNTMRANGAPKHVPDEHVRELMNDINSGMAGPQKVTEQVQSIPTKDARDYLGKKSPLVNVPAPDGKGNVGLDGNIKATTDKDKTNLMRRRSLKRYLATIAEDDVGSTVGLANGRPDASAPVSSPIPTVPKKKTFKEYMFAADAAVSGESGNSNNCMGEDGCECKPCKKKKAMKEHIVKVKGGFELKSKSTGRNLGKYPTKAGAEKRERQVQYFKHLAKENAEIEESKNTPYVKPFSEKGSDKQLGWKASNKHGRVKYFGMDFKASAHKHAGISEDSDPCWKGYEMEGMKKKGKKEVPNCVPKEEIELGEKRGLWDNIHAKQERIKHGSGEHMRKPGSKGAPTNAAFKASQNEAANPAQQAAIAIAMKKAGKKPKNEQVDLGETKGAGAKVYNDYRSKSIAVNTQRYAKQRYQRTGILPGSKTSMKDAEAEFFAKGGKVKKYDTRGNPIDESSLIEQVKAIMERGEDSHGYKRSTESGAGLTRKGAKHFGIKTAVTTPPSKLDPNGKAAKRRKSFCARMGGMRGPMKDEKGRPTRKAMSLRRWNCEETDKGDTL